MSVQRKELLNLHELLSGPEGKQVTNNVSDLELLRSVVGLVKNRTKQSGDKSHVGESLAFDITTRQKLLDDAAQAQNQLWTPLEKFDDQLRRDYTCRRQMLLTRLDCTIESFKWKGADGGEPKGGNAKSMNEQIHETYEKARLGMKDEPQVSMAHLLAAREADCDKLLNYVVSGSRGSDCKIRYGNKSGGDKQLISLKHVIIPTVPDRGGRPDEARQPPKESFNHGRRGYRENRGRNR